MKTRDTKAPHMAVHLCIIFNVIFIYISLVPRSNLLLDDEYNDYGELGIIFFEISQDFAHPCQLAGLI
jgi:hypothetical protein